MSLNFLKQIEKKIVYDVFFSGKLVNFVYMKIAFSLFQFGQHKTNGDNLCLDQE